MVITFSDGEIVVFLYLFMFIEKINNSTLSHRINGDRELRKNR